MTAPRHTITRRIAAMSERRGIPLAQIPIIIAPLLIVVAACVIIVIETGAVFAVILAGLGGIAVGLALAYASARIGQRNADKSLL